MQFGAADAIAIAFLSSLIVLDIFVVRRAWSEPGAAKVVSNLQKGLPYLGIKEIRALLRASPSLLVCMGSLVIGVAIGFVATATNRDSALRPVMVIIVLVALVVAAAGGIAALATATLARPKWAIPPPFRD